LASKKRAAAGGARRPQGTNMKVFYAILAVVAILGVGAIVYAARAGGGDMATEPLEIPREELAGVLERARGVSVGEPDAPAQMIVFSDYMCPACAHWAGQIEQLLKAEFVATGRLHYTYYDFPLAPGHRHSFVASRAARCAGDQGRFWEYHDRLLGQQQSWMYSASTPTDQLLQISQNIGLDQGAFENCLRSDAHAEVVTANKLLGETLGVGGTPTVFLNGRQLTEWNSYPAVRRAVEAAAGPTGSGAPAGGTTDAPVGGA
jgi:protein-disulfide isomerase